MEEVREGYCRCGCGQKTNRISHNNTKRGYVKGQLFDFVHGHKSAPHGFKIKEHPLRPAWCDMKARCNNPNDKAFKYYGARGIKVCTEWSESFVAFLRDMGAKPFPKATIERIDNDGDYEPLNVKWATYKEQANNTRRNRHVVLNGETLTISLAAEKVGVPYRTFHERLFGRKNRRRT